VHARSIRLAAVRADELLEERRTPLFFLSDVAPLLRPSRRTSNSSAGLMVRGAVPPGRQKEPLALVVEPANLRIEPERGHSCAHRTGAMAHGLADILAYQAGSRARGPAETAQTTGVAFRVKIELHGERFERDVVSELLELADESFGALFA
jgi:hypothetical protein